jgi:Transglycosylase SLT domain
MEKPTKRNPVYNIKAWKYISDHISSSTSNKYFQALLGIGALVGSYVVAKYASEYLSSISRTSSQDQEEQPYYTIPESSTTNSVKEEPESKIHKIPTSKRPRALGSSTRFVETESTTVGSDAYYSDTSSSGSLSSSTTADYVPNYVVPSLSSGYRQKIQFTGFTNADGISRYGTYTEEEAKTIVRLKQAKANTSYSKGRLDTEVENYIRGSATKHGVDVNTALQIAMVESGGNPNAISSTGAIGIYQFTGDTATEIGLANRFDMKQNVDAGMRLIRKRAKYVPESKASMLATYLTLQLGPGGASELLTVDASTPIYSLSSRLQFQISKNIGSSSGTVGDYLSANAKALSTKATYVAESKPASKTTTIVVPIVSNVVATNYPTSVLRYRKGSAIALYD